MTSATQVRTVVVRGKEKDLSEVDASQLRIRYNGRSSQPSMTNLLDVTDDADPLNVSRGNPGLKPSWTDRFNLFYNDYLAEKQRGWMIHADASMTRNSISTAVLYDEKTGKRTSMPMNIMSP